MVGDMRDLGRQVGQRIAHFRRVHPAGAISQERLAERIGVSASLLRKIERGDRSISLVLIGRVTEGLGVRAHDLICSGLGIEDRRASAQALVEFVERKRLSRPQVAALARLLRACWERSP